MNPKVMIIGFKGLKRSMGTKFRFRVMNPFMETKTIKLFPLVMKRDFSQFFFFFFLFLNQKGI